MKVIVTVQLVLVISESVSSQLISQKETVLNESCRTTGEIVEVGTCIIKHICAKPSALSQNPSQLLARMHR